MRYRIVPGKAMFFKWTLQAKRWWWPFWYAVWWSDDISRLEDRVRYLRIPPREL